MNRIVIVCAGPIKNYKKIRKYIKKNDYFIFCDGGLIHQKPLKVAPDMIIGDFDSYKKNPIILQKKYKNCKIITLPTEKDDTDSIYASKKAMELKPTEVILLGAVGNRFDQSMANISILINLFKISILKTRFTESSKPRQMIKIKIGWRGFPGGSVVGSPSVNSGDTNSTSDRGGSHMLQSN